MSDPVELGGGKRIFRDDGSLRPLRLVATVVSAMRSDARVRNQASI